MPLYSLKLSTYDPEIINAFERLRKCRKQATFTHEAIKQFLATERGKQVLANMEGSTLSQQLAASNSMTAETTVKKPPHERPTATTASGFASLGDSSNILDNILK